MVLAKRPQLLFAGQPFQNGIVCIVPKFCKYRSGIFVQGNSIILTLGVELLSLRENCSCRSRHTHRVASKSPQLLFASQPVQNGIVCIDPKFCKYRSGIFVQGNTIILTWGSVAERTAHAGVDAHTESRQKACDCYSRHGLSSYSPYCHLSPLPS